MQYIKLLTGVNQFHDAESFWQICYTVGQEFPLFMQLLSPLLGSQDSITGPYPNLNESNSQIRQMYTINGGTYIIIMTQKFFGYFPLSSKITK